MRAQCLHSSFDAFILLKPSSTNGDSGTAINTTHLLDIKSELSVVRFSFLERIISRDSKLPTNEQTVSFGLAPCCCLNKSVEFLESGKKGGTVTQVLAHVHTCMASQKKGELSEERKKDS